ncbi:MAG: hypothetical protein VB071_14800 [Lawsonibacter sp.]|nr:hypothetical protein [Lawsonibacter sp.]
MKRSLILPCVFCLLAGLLVGGILPIPWEVSPTSNTILRTPASSSSSDVSVFSNAAPEPLDSKDNLSLLNAACYVVQALKNEDYEAVASVVDPEKGVTFTPYSTVDLTSDKTFTRNQIKNLSQDNTVYTWGLTDGRGSLINMTMGQYFATYVWNTDYTNAPQIGVDQIIMSGNALENLKDAYQSYRFVDFCFPSLDPAKQGLDWCSLKLVFAPGDTSWYLVGIVHGQWTI